MVHLQAPENHKKSTEQEDKEERKANKGKLERVQKEKHNREVL